MTTGADFEDHGRRNTILAMLGVAAGLCIMVVGLTLDISSLGGLWPGDSADEDPLPRAVLPPLEDPGGNELSFGTPVATVEGTDGPVGNGARGAVGTGEGEAPAPTPAPGALETVLTAAGDAATELLEPVIDVSALSEWLLPPTTDDARLLPALDLAIV